MRKLLLIVAAALALAAGCADDSLQTESGIKYEILRAGNGVVPQRGDVVHVNYTALHMDGRKFDSSYDAGQPFALIAGVGNVIRGWDEVLLTMDIGSHWIVTIPSVLAFGERGKPEERNSAGEVVSEAVGPNMDIKLEIELLRIVDEEFRMESGIRYTIINRGLGEMPNKNQSAVVHYNVWLPDWQKLGSSFYSGTPYEVDLAESQVIEGWKQILPVMPQGSRWKVVIPSELAYGEKGRDIVPPNTDLTFELLLLGIK